MTLSFHWCFCLIFFLFKLQLEYTWNIPSRQILVPRTSQGHPHPTSPGRLLKILFDHPGDVIGVLRRPNLTSWERLEMTSSGRPNLAFKGRLWEADSGRPQDVLRTSSRGTSEYSNLDVPKKILTYSIDQTNLKAFQHSRCIKNIVKLLR